MSTSNSVASAPLRIVGRPRTRPAPGHTLQAIGRAGPDGAAHLWHRRRAAGSGGAPTVAVCAGALNHTLPGPLASRKLQEGHRAFRLKVDFGSAREMSAVLAEFSPLWLEEPIAADLPLPAWQEPARDSKIALAAGGSVHGTESLDAALASAAFGVIPAFRVSEGKITPSAIPGLGVVPNLPRHRTLSGSIRRRGI